jgi:hypothetical protein
MDESVASFPAVAVEIGLAGNSPSQPPASLSLNDATFGLLDTDTLGNSSTWADISNDVLAFTVARVMTRNQGLQWSYQGGTCSITLDNSSGNYDPDNAGSPYAGQLLPMLPVRIRSSFGPGSRFFTGYADGFTPADVTFSGDYAELVLPGSDAFKVFTGVTLPTVAVTGAGADTGARIKDILSRVGWYPSAEWEHIDTGNSLLQGTTLSDTALSLMQVATDSEIGQLYMNGAGAVVFRCRRSVILDARSNTVQAVFGDSPGTSHAAGTELICAMISRSTDDTTMINDIQATNTGGILQEVRDAVSIAKYLFPRTYPRSDLILQTDTDALNWANWLLAVGRNAESRFDTITINPLSDPANLWPQVLNRDIGDRIQIWERPSSVTTPVVKDCFIMGVTHTVDVKAPSWSTTWVLQDASKYGSFLVLDNSTLGKLDSNALVF